MGHRSFARARVVDSDCVCEAEAGCWEGSAVRGQNGLVWVGLGDKGFLGFLVVWCSNLARPYRGHVIWGLELEGGLIGAWDVRVG